VFVFLGKFVDVKEPGVFVETVARAAEQVPGIAGLMAGDGPLRAATEALAVRLKAPIRFTGFLNQSEIARAYAVSDVLVVPSRSETWGLVVNEAMACGIPALVSDGVGCAGDLIEPGVTGDVFRVGAVPELTGQMATLARDVDYRERLADNALRHVQRFDVTATVSGTVRAVRELALARSGRPSLREASL